MGSFLVQMMDAEEEEVFGDGLKSCRCWKRERGEVCDEPACIDEPIDHMIEVEESPIDDQGIEALVNDFLSCVDLDPSLDDLKVVIGVLLQNIGRGLKSEERKIVIRLLQSKVLQAIDREVVVA